MINVENRVLANVKSYISDKCKVVQNDSKKTPTSLPALSVEQIDNPDRGVDLENSEVAVKSVIELQSFSSKDITEAKNVMFSACDAMRIMGYIRTYGPRKIPNASNTNIYRMVARFERLISSVEELEKIKF